LSKAPSINGKLYFNSDIIDYDLVTLNDQFTINKLLRNDKILEVTHEKSNTTQKFIGCQRKFAIHINDKDQRQPVLDIDISNGGLGVSASNDGSLLIWLLENGQIRRRLHGHIDDVNISRFFPSGIVVLSGGADFRIKIWSAETGNCATTMIGHTAGINDFSIVDKGRNIVSVSRDGQCKLWDVGENKCLDTIYKQDSVINSCSITSSTQIQLPTPTNLKSDREIETDNKIIACGCDDGTLSVIALRSRQQISVKKYESSVNCCCFISETLVACGNQNGNINIWDIQNNKY
jgi:proteasomal ATPase-associated factor 1